MKYFIPGNETAHRALEIAIKGNHSIKFIGNEEAEVMATVAKNQFHLTAFACKPCPCGNFGDMGKACICTPEAINAQTTLNNQLKADITVQITRTDFAKIENYFHWAGITAEAVALLNAAYTRLHLNSTEVDSCVKVARTIAALDNNSHEIKPQDIAEALQYRTTVQKQ